MKANVLILILLFAISATSCQKEKKIEYEQVFNQICTFNVNDEQNKPVPSDGILMLDTNEIEDFNNTYFANDHIDFDFKDQNEGELFIQVPSDDIFEVDTFGVTTIYKTGKVLTVNIKKTGTALVDYSAEFKGQTKWVTILKVDKKYLNDSLEIHVVDRTGEVK